YKKDSAWTLMKSVGTPLNTPSNEGAQTISADGLTMVYTICNRKGVGRCDLVISHYENEAWSEPKGIGAPVNTSYKETQPALTADGRVLYYACDRPDGKGGLDLWRSTRKEDGTWSKPENLGDSINNEGEQMAPFIHHDGKTLYFASNKHIGMGGFDIYKATLNDSGTFTEIVNLGYPINTHQDDFGLIVNAKGDMAYYASGAEAQNGQDIFRFEMPVKIRPQGVSYFKGMVYDAISKKRLQANIELQNLNSGEVVFLSKSSKDRGEFLVCIPTNNNYLLNVSCNGYLFYSDNFIMEGTHEVSDPYVKDIPLQPVKPGTSIVLNNIFFETDKYDLKPESKHELDKLVAFLKSNWGFNIEISGHTDNQGKPDYNQQLSERRAQSVVDYLIENQIPESRLTFKGYGMTKPVATNDTKEGRAQNRRTEMMVVQ
ncbi:MAG: OmpA family protein, partial [Bacteroidales bacterium]|nr:OmpA family protein [Bacteroidales bacterium]